MATNLAIFLKALDEDLPVSIFSFDNHFTIDKMFSFKGDKHEHTVTDLLSGETGNQLLQTGQYGVNFIPSSQNLSQAKKMIKGPMSLARMISTSEMDGILIIDTRPDLDILTENALYAADKVLIPVKDMPSLENCRNIFALFDKRGLDKKSLVLIPCLIDERIKFDGLFADQKTLLRAFAINRGYKCHDTYISKSPKVESLNTNPDGKIYPVLTHGRGTDVHGQFTALARDILADYQATKEPRSLLFHNWLEAENEKERISYEARLGGLNRDCLICKRNILPESIGTAGYYYETSDGIFSGFLEEDCFLKVLSQSIYNIKGQISDEDPTLMLLRESTRDSIFVLRPHPENCSSAVEFRRYDSSGQLLTNRRINYRDHAGGMFHDDRCPLYDIVGTTLSGYGNSFREAFLIIHPVEPGRPDKILQKESYRSFSTIKGSIAAMIT